MEAEYRLKSHMRTDSSHSFLESGKEIDEETRENLLVARISTTICRRLVSKRERKRELTELAELMLKRGVPKGKIANEIAEKTGLSRRYVRKLLPRKFKLLVKAKAGAKGRAKQLAEKEKRQKKSRYNRLRVLWKAIKKFLVKLF